VAGLLLILAGSWLSTGGSLPPSVSVFGLDRARARWHTSLRSPRPDRRRESVQSPEAT
jgi:hypothetical protein